MDEEDLQGWPSGAPPASALCGEDERASVLAAFGVDSLEDDPELAGVVKFAAHLCEAPVALVSVVESERQRFLAREGLDLRETPRDVSFCAHAMLGGELMVVPDAARDPRFADNALVTGPEQVRFYAGAPLISSEGAPLGALCVIDRTPRQEGLSDHQREGLGVLAQAVMRRLQMRRMMRLASHEAQETLRHMRGIADLVPAIIWSADGKGMFDYFNRRWSEVTGAERPKTPADWRTVVHEDDADTTFAGWQKSFADGVPYESEYRLKQANGSWRWVLARGMPLHRPEGGVARWYGILTDIDKSRRLSQDRDLLARELSHRIKNIFAVLSGLVAIKARQHSDAQALADELTSSIFALGRAHEFVGPVEGKKGESLHGLLAELMAPYDDGDGGRVRIEGGDCKIGPRAATPLALVFHELATNAAKYGAFATDKGWVEIHLDCPDDDGTAAIAWRERGGPKVSEPEEEGFGSRLLRTAVEGQLGGKMKRRFEPEGLQVELEIKGGVIRR